MVEKYNLGISADLFQTGSLSRQIFDAIVAKSSHDLSEEERIYSSLYAMDCAAMEATRVALSQNGFEIVWSEGDRDVWGQVEEIQLYTPGSNIPIPKIYHSFEAAVADWSPGQSFDFVVRQVSAKARGEAMNSIMQALDPDGSVSKKEVNLKGAGNSIDEEALLAIFDDPNFASLAGLTDSNVRRVSAASFATRMNDACYEGDNSRGYGVIDRSDLLADPKNTNSNADQKTVMHVMDALVSHGVLLVNMADSATHLQEAVALQRMWQAVELVFSTPGASSMVGTGSQQNYNGHSRMDTEGDLHGFEIFPNRHKSGLLPQGIESIFNDKEVRAVRDAFDAMASVGKDVVRIAVEASSIEHGAFDTISGADLPKDQRHAAAKAASLLADELIDDGKPLNAPSDAKLPQDPAGGSSQLLHQCTAKPGGEKYKPQIDSSFVTVVPLSAVNQLEVYDEGVGRWYSVGSKARAHWEERRKSDRSTGSSDANKDGDVPWHARYVAILPGELLQIATCDEVPSSMYRIVPPESGTQPWIPLLLRGRRGVEFHTKRYVGGTHGNSLMEECDGMTTDEIVGILHPR